MSPPAGFTVEGNRGYYRPHGEVSLDEGIALLVAATEHACSLGLRELLLNATGFTGYELPDILDRYQFASTLAHIGAGNLRVAQVMPADIIDPCRFGILVAHNRNLETKAFTNEADAVAWLDEPRSDAISPERRSYSAARVNRKILNFSNLNRGGQPPDPRDFGRHGAGVQ